MHDKFEIDSWHIKNDFTNRIQLILLLLLLLHGRVLMSRRFIHLHHMF